MYGICNQCGHQEEVTSAYCPECNHLWNLFPTQPKDTESWKEKHGPLDRARRSFPPMVLYGLYLGTFSFFAMVFLDIWAYFEDVHLSSFSRYPPFYFGLMLYDLVCLYFAFKTLRLSKTNYERLKMLLWFSLGATTVLFFHTAFRVIGPPIIQPAIQYLLGRLLLLICVMVVFVRARVSRAVDRHGHPSS